MHKIRSKRRHSQQGVVDAGHLYPRPGREIGSFDEPHRVVDSKPPAAIDDRALEGECPADIDLCAPIETEPARTRVRAKATRPIATPATARAANINA
jgi:hypothetical protein